MDGATMSYKVLRLLEYTYNDVEEADEDMKRWSVPPNGPLPFMNRGKRGIRSTIIQYPEKDEAPHPLANLHDLPGVDTGLLREYGHD
jgi:hypothetical protein